MEIPAEIKELEAKLHDSGCDGFMKCDYRQKLMDIEKNIKDKTLKKYIDEILKKG
jgi:hypothetical protein